MEFYASCPEGFENALTDELKGLGLSQVRKLKGRVTFEGPLEDAYRACLWSRLASRVFTVLGRFSCANAEELYEGAYALPWERTLAPGATFAVSARGTNAELRNTRFTALRVKDAICDRMAETTGARADVDTNEPDLRIALSIRGDRASVNLDLTGEPLFWRLPREATRNAGKAAAHVLRPDYAALVLAQGGWAETCKRAASEAESAAPALIDASCAGGGIVLEAASQLLDRAPGALRQRWGFEGWAGHDEDAWARLLDEADERSEAAEGRALRIIATDPDPDALAFAQHIVRAAGLGRRVAFVAAQADAVREALGAEAPAGADASAGTAPTCGMIVADVTETPINRAPLAHALIAGLAAAPELEGFGLVALTHDETLARALSRTPAQTLAIKPNNEDALVLTFNAAATGANADADAPNAPAPLMSSATTIDLGDGQPIPVLIPESEQFAHRLKKVARLRRRWAKREGVSCYRVYDADLPDYAAAIDLYVGAPATPGRWLVIAEYTAPRSIDPALAQARFLDILAIAPRILDVEPRHVYARARTRSRGGSQYGRRRKEAGGTQQLSPLERRLPLIEEGGLTFAVNFDDYLDTGIFLDHRITRGIVREHAHGARRFLNLFAYTGTATCYAADAGVEETVTVDLSNTYLDWAERNMRQNGFTGAQHHFVRDDVRRWVEEQRHTYNRWDLIFCDPPTFSNSSKMGSRTFDVQRDHAELIIGISRLLTREGEAIFSCNLRTFRPDTEKLARAGVILTDITPETIPEDFARNKRIHRCYIARRYEIAEAMRMAGLA